MAEGYIEESVGYKRKLGLQISNAVAAASTSVESVPLEQPTKRQKLEKDQENNNEASTSNIIHKETFTNSSINAQGTPMVINISNCSNPTFLFRN